ncbi:DNA topoisomerase 3-alpha [Coemansia sp. RSA 1358]|uniref:DNA topoisomerase n=1 Tax=Coemansia umbellata TaxID=1424467 RepID=A0ABQ8PGD3_9FUNG|nr:DNA topoisomerase 3-alpha [Coemansia umbellata]KAJ2620072.1 DNA topoisomerase 3-alpha [Coemansia sp. RSA 1358]
MRILCVAEKPSQAKAIVQILSQGRHSTRDGPSVYNKNFDFEYRVSGNFVRATMTSVLGHIRDINFPQNVRKWTSCDPVQLFSAPIVKTIGEKVADIAKNLEQEARSATHLYIWTDCDREGEAIGGEVAEVCHMKNPRIIVKRAHFSSVLPQEIHNAMQNPRELDMRQIAAVEARTELDLRIGSALTRYQTLRLTSRFAAVKDKLISYGPCQFPTLGFVVDQFLRVESFVPEPFWYIFLDHAKEDGRAVFSWKRNKIFDQEVCFVLYHKCVNTPTVTITSVRSRPKEKWRPLPLTTVELQKCCARFLRMAPDKIMSTAESLYNKGFISYPRTETDQFDTNMDLRGTVTKLTQYQPFADYARRLANNGEFRWPRQGKNNDKAHPPIHPVAPANNLEGDEKRLYEFVTRRFLACCSENAKGQATEVDAMVAGELFSTKGLMIIARNYLDIYPFDRWAESTVPVYTQGDTFEPTTLEMRDGMTTAPKLLTYADLVDIMDKNGIGTDATHAEHIKKITDREYIFKSPDNTLTPSTLGIGLVEGYDAIGLELSLSKPYLRREMERELKLICEGVKSKQIVVDDSIRLYKAVYVKSTEDIEKLEAELSRCLQEAPISNGSVAWTPDANRSNGEEVGACFGCDGRNGIMMLRSRATGGWMIGCNLYPQCKCVVWVPDIVSAISVSSENCHICLNSAAGPAKLLNMQFKPGSVPPGIPARYRGCIRGCDELINEMFKIRTSSSANSANFQPNSYNNGQRSQEYNNCLMAPISIQPTRSIPLQPSPQPGLASGSVGGGGGGGGSSSGGSNALSNNPLCVCGIVSVQRVTVKEGPNKGRSFFVCSKPQDVRCDFFQWVDQPSTSSGFSNPNTNGQSYRQPSPSIYSSVDEDSAIVKPKCRCGLYAKLKQKLAGGPNQGREYYLCTREYNGCGFVCWKDEVQVYMARSSGNGSSSSVPASVASASNCYKCGQVGHWARDCTSSASAADFAGLGDVASFLSRPPERPAPSGPLRRGRTRGRGRGGSRARGRGRGRGSRSSAKSAVQTTVAEPEYDGPDPDFDFWS